MLTTLCLNDYYSYYHSNDDSYDVNVVVGVAVAVGDVVHINNYCYHLHHRLYHYDNYYY